MSDATKLQCVYCWISSPTDGHSTHCQHCGQPLHLSDGRRVIDVMATASEQAAAYKAAGQNPRLAPAAAEAKATLAPPRRPTNFVSVVRGVIALSILMSLAELAYVSYEGSPHDRLYLAPGPILLVAAGIYCAAGAIAIWIAKWMLGRVLFLGVAVLGVVQGTTVAASPYWLLANWALTVIYVSALALSIIYPPPRSETAFSV